MNGEIMRLKGLNLRHIVFLFFEVLCVSSTSAQVSHGGMPCPKYLSDVPALRSTASSPYKFERMPAVDEAALLREDSLSGYTNRRFAYKFKVDLGMDNAGKIDYMEDGAKVWRLGITSQGARSLNLIFSEFEIPEQARLFVYSPDRSMILGSFTAENRQPSGILPVAPVEGDSLIVEYVEPAGADFEGRLRVGDVNHDYVGFRSLLDLRHSAECEVDINYNERSNWDQKRSVCLIMINGTHMCTGSLLNNTAEDDAPLVLSASHCLFMDEKEVVDKSMAETSVFFFNYERPYCMTDIKLRGTMEQSVAGATVVACNKQRDMLMCKLSENVPVDYRPYYSGWNATEELTGPFTMIHHPNGDMKKVSVEQDLVYTASFYLNAFLPQSHWRVDRWEVGISEPGSSGSPLFDADKRVVGALSGGSVSISCANRGEDNFYRLYSAWSSPSADSLQLSKHLDPLGSGRLKIDGKEANGGPCIRLSNLRYDDSFYPQGKSSLGYASGHNEFGYLRYAEKFETEGVNKIYGVYFIPFVGKYSETNSVKVSIYSGDEEPTTLLHQQVLKIQNTVYSSKKFNDELIADWASRENYLRLDSVVTAENNFFVVFDLPENAEDKFALFYSGTRWDDRNTAYFYNEGAWHSFRDNPMVKSGSSLAVDVVCQCSATLDRPEALPRKKTSVVRKSSGDLCLLFEEGKGAKEVLIYDVSGRLLEKSRYESDWHALDAPYGVSIVRVVYSDYTETLKIVK